LFTQLVTMKKTRGAATTKARIVEEKEPNTVVEAETTDRAQKGARQKRAAPVQEGVGEDGEREIKPNKGAKKKKKVTKTAEDTDGGPRKGAKKSKHSMKRSKDEDDDDEDNDDDVEEALPKARKRASTATLVKRGSSEREQELLDSDKWQIATGQTWAASLDFLLTRRS
jgi:hypothetical protein